MRDERTLAAIAAVERAIDETLRGAFKRFSRTLDRGTLNDWLVSEPED